MKLGPETLRGECFRKEACLAFREWNGRNVLGIQAPVAARFNRGHTDRVEDFAKLQRSTVFRIMGTGKHFTRISFSMSDHPTDVPQELLDNADYQVLAELGRGGMGVVFLAKYLPMDRMEVLKVLDERMVKKESARQRFISEMKAIGKLNHPFIATAFQRVLLQKQLVFSMEYVPGIDLHKFAQKYHPVPIPIACTLVRQIAMALQHAHAKGMVHRDIKPSNVMVFRNDGKLQIKVLDFGLAKATSEETAEGLTSDGTMLGTPEYMAPEQALDAASADIRADIYSLGCTLFHLLVGKPPYNGTFQSVLMAHAQNEIQNVSLSRTDAPNELAEVVAKMMAKDPADRYQLPTEVATALKPFADLSQSQSLVNASSESRDGDLNRNSLRYAAKDRIPGKPSHSNGDRDTKSPVDLSVRLANLETVPRRRPKGSGKRAQLTLIGILILVGSLGAYVWTLHTNWYRLVLENLDHDSVVWVDGQQVTIDRKGEKNRGEVDLAPGTHLVRVESNGAIVLDERVSIPGPNGSLVSLDLQNIKANTNAPLSATSSPPTSSKLKPVEVNKFPSFDHANQRRIPRIGTPVFLSSEQEVTGAWYERYENIPGMHVSELVASPSYPNSPDASHLIDEFEVPSGMGEAYGARVRALLRPPVTGDYVFWISSGDASELWLSSDTDSQNAEMIIQLSDVELPGRREWNAVPEQQSKPVRLKGGSVYYVEARMKEWYGRDYLAVAWSGPHAEEPTIIGGDFLAPVGYPDRSDLFQAVPDIVATASDEPVDIGVLINDRILRADFETGQFAFKQPKRGRVSLVSKGVVRYDPEPGFAGVDTFDYSLTNGSRTVAGANVTVYVNTSFEHADARKTILANVDVLSDPNAPGEMVVYGPTAISIANYPGESVDRPMIAASSLGKGRIIAMPDAQWLLMNEYGDAPSMKNFYFNSLAWLSRDQSKEIRIAFYKEGRGKFVEEAIEWLRSQGYFNTYPVDNSSLTDGLASADVFVSDWLGGGKLPEEVEKALQAFVVDGGGMLVGEYGYGHKLWWKLETVDIPGNRLLRHAGIGFVKDDPTIGPQVVTPASEQINGKDLVDSIAGGTPKFPEAVIRNISRKIREVLPKDDLYRATLELVSSSQ